MASDLSAQLPAETKSMTPATLRALGLVGLGGVLLVVVLLSLRIGSIVGPATAGMLIGHDLPFLWVGLVVGGTAMAAAAFLSLRAHLTDEQDGLAPERVPVHS